MGVTQPTYLTYVQLLGSYLNFNGSDNFIITFRRLASGGVMADSTGIMEQQEIGKGPRRDHVSEQQQPGGLPTRRQVPQLIM